jgi:hypothetical protein
MAMRSYIRKAGSVFIFAAVLFLLQAGIQLLHVHYSNSCYDQQDGFHTLSTSVTCLSVNSHSNPPTDSPALIPAAINYPAPFTSGMALSVADVPPFLDCTHVSDTRERASPA